VYVVSWDNVSPYLLVVEVPAYVGGFVVVGEFSITLKVYEGDCELILPQSHYICTWRIQIFSKIKCSLSGYMGPSA
jgi:hypothetical protein